MFLLPNVVGRLNAYALGYVPPEYEHEYNGAIKNRNIINNRSIQLIDSSNQNLIQDMDFDASKFSAIFGASRLQPRAFNLLMIIKN